MSIISNVMVAVGKTIYKGDKREIRTHNRSIYIYTGEWNQSDGDEKV